MLILSHLRQKPTAFSVVDAFAGDAVYDLAGPEAEKTREFDTGIARIWAAESAPPSVSIYLNAVRSANPDGNLKAYPGSPALAQSQLRDDDRLILNELHPAAYRALGAWAADDRRIAVHRRDALELMGALVNPQLRRGVVLIDPAFEVKAEYETIPKAVGRAVRNWPQGIFAIWYPVLAEARHVRLLTSLSQVLSDANSPDAVVAELEPPASVRTAGRGMQGAGMVIINPPWRFHDDMDEAGGWLAQRLWAPQPGRHRLFALAEIRQPGK